MIYHIPCRLNCELQNRTTDGEFKEIHPEDAAICTRLLRKIETRIVYLFNYHKLIKTFKAILIFSTASSRVLIINYFDPYVTRLDK